MHTLRTSVHDDLWGKDEEDELEQAQSEGELGPVVSVLQNLQSISVEGNLVIKVLLHEGLHGDLVSATVCLLVCLVFEGKVKLNWATWKGNLLVSARAEVGKDVPETDEDGDGRDETKEDRGLQSTTELP